MSELSLRHVTVSSQHVCLALDQAWGLSGLQGGTWMLTSIFLTLETLKKILFMMFVKMIRSFYRERSQELRDRCVGLGSRMWRLSSTPISFLHKEKREYIAKQQGCVHVGGLWSMDKQLLRGDIGDEGRVWLNDITECRPERGDVSRGWLGRRNSSGVESDQYWLSRILVKTGSLKTCLIRVWSRRVFYLYQFLTFKNSCFSQFHVKFFFFCKFKYSWHKIY